MSRLVRDGTAEPVSRDQFLRHERGQGKHIFSCSAYHEQDSQPEPVDSYSAICDDHTYIPNVLWYRYELKPQTSNTRSRSTPLKLGTTILLLLL